MSAEGIEQPKEHFGKLLAEQLARVERMKADEEWLDYERAGRPGADSASRGETPLVQGRTGGAEGRPLSPTVSGIVSAASLP